MIGSPWTLDMTVKYKDGGKTRHIIGCENEIEADGKQMEILAEAEQTGGELLNAKLLRHRR